MLRALGYRFLDDEGADIPPGGAGLLRLARIDGSGLMPEARAARFTAACDVRSPLYGPEGAACVFAPQKGAGPAMVDALDEGLRRLARVVRQYNQVEIGLLPGAGAAGGMGGGLHALLGAALRPGIELVLDTAGFDRRLEGASLVVTGEGKADRQTLMGKVPAGVLGRAARRGIPIVLLAGRVEDAERLLGAGFRRVCAVNPPGTPLETALRPDYARARLCETAARMMREIFPQESL